MARAVSPWTWARVLRDYGPDDCGFLLAMQTLRTWMDRDGFAYPSQKVWARGARMHVKTVRKHMQRAVEGSWLGVESANRGGQAWRHYVYRAAVPDHIELADIDEQITDAVTAAHGVVGDERGEIACASPQPKGGYLMHSPPSPTSASTWGTSQVERGENDIPAWGKSTPDVGAQLVPTKSALRTPALRTPAPEEGALSRTPVVLKDAKEEDEEVRQGREAHKRVMQRVRRMLPGKRIAS